MFLSLNQWESIFQSGKLWNSGDFEVTVPKVHEPHDSSAGAGGLSYVCWMKKFILRLGLVLGAGVAGSVH